MAKPSLYSDDFVIDMEKSKFAASDVLEQLFDDDSDFSGTDSGGEGEDILCLLGTNFESFYFESFYFESFYIESFYFERGDSREHFSGKCF